jgi:hypothetical protein
VANKKKGIMTIMKKIVALLLTMLLLTGMAYASAESVVGGWNIPDSPVITDEVKAAFDKAMEGFVGSTFEPIAYLGSQIVAGTNYCILCKVTPVLSPDYEAAPGYELVYIYEDLEGNAEITQMTSLDIAELATAAE